MNVSSGGKPPDPDPNKTITEDSFRGFSDEEMRDSMEKAIQIGGKVQTQNRPNLNQKNDKQQKRYETIYYNQTNIGPYQIYSKPLDPDFPGKLNAIKINMIIFSCHPEIDGKIKEIQSIGRAKIRVILKEYKSANLLINSKYLSEKHNLNAYLPNFLVQRTGVIKGIDTDISIEFLKQNIKPFDMHSIFSVKDVQRVTFKELNQDKQPVVDNNGQIKRVPGRTIIVTFNSQILPEYVAIGHVRFPVEKYIQKVILCYNCYRYGHQAKQCRSATRCEKCNQDHKTKDCKESELETKCFGCSGKHSTNDFKNCPEFTRQKTIKETMALENVSYRDASVKIPKQTYADILNSGKENNVNKSHFIQPQNNISIGFNSNKPTSGSSLNLESSRKRLRTSEPDQTRIMHNQLLKPYTLPNHRGGVINDPIYTSNLQNPFSEDHFTGKIVDIVMTIISTLKEKKTFEVRQSDLVEVIKNKFGHDSVIRNG